MAIKQILDNMIREDSRSDDECHTKHLEVGGIDYRRIDHFEMGCILLVGICPFKKVLYVPWNGPSTEGEGKAIILR